MCAVGGRRGSALCWMEWKGISCIGLVSAPCVLELVLLDLLCMLMKAAGADQSYISN